MQKPCKSMGRPSMCAYPWSKLMLLLFTALSLCTTRAQPAMNNSITIEVHNAPIENVFSLIEKQSGGKFIYDDDILSKAKNVSMTIKKGSLDEALKRLLAGQPFQYTVRGNMIIIGQLNIQPRAVQEYIRGTVLDAGDHQPVINATVRINNRIRCFTDKEGRFRTERQEGDSVLEVTNISYQKFTQKIGTADYLTIYLDATIAQLDSVQVISNGYTTIPKERATGSFDIIDQQLFQQQASMDILSRLDAVASGVTTDKATTTGGLMIRGLSTISGPKAPLIVVDNFPYDGDIANINPNDVESISILKDAAAASIWGARAGNGVIVITTRKGRYKQAPVINFSSFLQTSAKPDLHYIRQINTPDFIDVEKYLFNNGFYDGDINSLSVPVISPVVETLQKQKNGLINETDAENAINALRNLDVRDQYKKYMYRPSFNQQYALSFQGGTNVLNWITGIGADQQIGNLNATNDRNNIRFDVNYKPLKNLEAGAGIYYTEYKTGTGRPGYGDIKTNNAQTMPYAQFASKDGSPLVLYKGYAQAYKDTAGGGRLLDWNYYPLEDYMHDHDKNEVFDNIISLHVRYEFLFGMSASLLYQHERQKTGNQQIYDDQSYYARDLINYFTQRDANGTLAYPVPKGGILDRNVISMSSNDVRFQINYDKNWHNYSFNILSGYELRRQRNNGYRNRYYGYQPDISTVGYMDYTESYPDYIDGYPTQVPMMDNIDITQTNFISYFANGAFSYRNKYTVSFSARRDASNLFGLNTNDQWNPFWSVGASWKLSDEKFYHIDFLPYLKVKATYGFSGNIDPSMSAVTTILYQTNNTYLNTPTARFDNIYNPDLKWETSRMIDYSIEFKTHHNIINGSVDYYRKNGKDLFGYSPLDYTTGVGSSILKNAANMVGNGWDIKLTAMPVNRLLQWTITGNISNYTDKVTKNYLKNNNGHYFVGKDGNGSYGVPGNAVVGVYAYKWAGLDPGNGNPVGYLNGTKSEDYMAITTTGTSVNDLRYFGSAQPTWFGSIINDLKYKNWELQWSVQFKTGYYIHRSSINYYSLFYDWTGNADFSKRWQQAGDENRTNVPSMVYPGSSARSAFYTGSETLVEKGDHIRLRYINFQYSLPLHRNRSVVFYLNGADLGILWKANHQGIDPDYNLGDYSIKPSPTYTFGIRINY